MPIFTIYSEKRDDFGNKIDQGGRTMRDVPSPEAALVAYLAKPSPGHWVPLAWSEGRSDELARGRNRDESMRLRPIVMGAGQQYVLGTPQTDAPSERATGVGQPKFVPIRGTAIWNGGHGFVFLGARLSPIDNHEWEVYYNPTTRAVATVSDDRNVYVKPLEDITTPGGIGALAKQMASEWMTSTGINEATKPTPDHWKIGACYRYRSGDMAELRGPLEGTRTNLTFVGGIAEAYTVSSGNRRSYVDLALGRHPHDKHDGQHQLMPEPLNRDGTPWTGANQFASMNPAVQAATKPASQATLATSTHPADLKMIANDKPSKKAPAERASFDAFAGCGFEVTRYGTEHVLAAGHVLQRTSDLDNISRHGSAYLL